jgi:hypothetical protein
MLCKPLCIRLPTCISIRWLRRLGLAGLPMQRPRLDHLLVRHRLELFLHAAQVYMRFMTGHNIRLNDGCKH